MSDEKENEILEFCKVFVSKKYGQIVIMIDEDDDEGEFPVFACSIYHSETGVAHMETVFKESADLEENWKLAEVGFANMTLEQVEEYARLMYEQIEEAIRSEQGSGSDFSDPSSGDPGINYSRMLH